LERPSVLYLDDEADNLIAFKAVFRRSYIIYTALNASEAWVHLNANSIHVIISDQRMPGVNGVDFLSEVANKYPDIIRMILTGYSDMEAVINAINKGKIYYYITKPYRFEELKVIIDKGLDAYNLHKENIKLMEENHSLVLKNVVQEKAQLLSQLETLKNQLNPHFLFNCLNTLASLIGCDPNEAIRFTTKFSKLYRMSLEHGEHQMIALSAEIDFLNTYIFLQQMRFGKNLSIDINIPYVNNYTLPPFALQLLVENSIKHNEISDEKPMNIQINQNEDTLTVVNTIYPRISEEFSTGVGLQNLSQRYKLLTNREIIVANDGFKFEVIIPLIYMD
jgi:LytS/YehU family sensor histidine kinase